MKRAIPKGVRWVVAGLLLALTPRAVAQEGGAEPAPIPADVEDTVARALYDRGLELYKAGRWAEAYQLFGESVARSPQGPVAPSARQMMTRAEAKMKSGARPDDTRGTVDEEPLPKPDPTSADEPMNPYEEAEAAADNDGLVDDGDERDELATQRLRLGIESDRSRTTLLIYGGAFGFWHGVALAGATDADGAGVLIAVGGLGLGLGGSYFLTRDRTIREGQALAVMSGATWGSLSGLFMGWAAGDLRDDTRPEYDGYGVGTLIGGAAGLGGGLFWASTEPTPGDVAVVNSFAGYGTVGGFLVGGMMDPPYDGAYGMNAFVGSLAGLGAGVLVANEIEVSRSRMAVIDLGAAIGAVAPWILVYPIIKEDESDGSNSNDDVQITSGVSLAAMAAGAILAWRFTDDYDERRGARRAKTSIPALTVSRDRGGLQLGLIGSF